MSLISVTPSSLMSFSNELKALQSNYVDTVKNIKEIYSSIENLRIWDGIDEDSYIDKLNERYYPTLDKIGELLFDYSEFLSKTSEIYTSVEDFINEMEIDI